MRKRLFPLGLLAACLTSFSLLSCSSGNGMGDDDMGDDNTGEGTTSGPTTGTIPENTDSGKNNNSEPDNVKPEETPSWTLVFEDNFEGNDSIPNTQYWKLAKKGDLTWNRYLSESYGQAYQKDGYLYLFGMMVDGEYQTGAIETQGLYSFTFGQVKCRARFLRQPQGNHTGIWMMPEPPAQEWPKSGEIDIMEHLNDTDVVYETAHYWDEEKMEDGSGRGEATIDNDEFNTYGIIWDKESISFTVNGEVKYTYSNNDPESEDFSYQYPFTQPFYLILSQSLGGKDTWEGEIDNSELPAIFQIDWIKVWQKEE